MPNKIKIEFCTSCGSKEIEVTGQKFYCSACDVTYKVTEAGTKVVDTNPLGKQNTRLDQVEKDIADLKGSKPAEQDRPNPPGADLANELGAEDLNAADLRREAEDDDEQDGFVTW